MDPATAIVTALVAGAAAAAKDTASDLVKDAYKGLKQLLSGRLASMALLEEDSSPEIQRVAAGEVAKKKLDEDPKVADSAVKLTEAVAREPAARLPLGVDLERVKAALDIVISGNRGSVSMRDVEGRNISITDNSITGNLGN